MKISEKVLYYVWQYRLYSHLDLVTKHGKTLKIKSPGQLNTHAGPDFEHCRLLIDGTEWAGNVEIHLKSSDWNVHKHQHDAAYNNVVLHVVYEDDEAITLSDGSTPETLVLQPLISPALLTKYNELMGSKAWVPCASHLATLDEFNVAQWLERIVIERLLEKQEMVNQLLKETAYDWEEVTYILLAKNFGFKVNALPFENLARNLPYKLLLKNRFHPHLVEALIFGQAGLLDGHSFQDVYPAELKKTYTHLRKQHQLTAIDQAQWRFLRMRPSNFPTLRLAQFAAWLIREEHLFAKIIASTAICDFRNLFVNLPVNPYWGGHYRFDVSSSAHSYQLGIASIDNIILNTAVTILFSYGKYIGKEAYIYRAINLLEQLAPENNNIIAQYRRLGIKVKTAADSQALLQLKQGYCSRFRCLDCGIGLQVFKLNKTL